MFKFLKDKLKKAAGLFSKKVEEQAEEKVIEKEVEVPVKVVGKAELPKKKVDEETPKKDVPAVKDTTPVKILKLPKKEIVKESPKEKVKRDIPIKVEKEPPLSEGERKGKEIEKKESTSEPKKSKFVKKVEAEIEQFKEKTEVDEVIEEAKKIDEKPIDEKPPVQEKEAVKKTVPEKKGFFKKLFTKKEPVDEEIQEPKTIFQKIKKQIITKVISDKKFEELFYELEVALLENNVALEVIDKIKNDLKRKLVGVPIPRGKIAETILKTLKTSIESLFMVTSINLLDVVSKKKPYVISFVGVNGSGKTTTIAKIAHYLKKNKLSSIISASDTFRAAAIDQLQKHADKLDIKMIKHDYGSDPAAVAFDAIKYAKARNIDVVLVDTAGRLHSDINLMDELKKITRVAKPDLTLFIGESITGNDCVEQARKFNEAVEIDAIILSKADVDEKGGAAISVSYVTGKPIIFLGTGQQYDDLTPFEKEIIMENIGL